MKDRWKVSGADHPVAAARKKFELNQTSLKCILPRSHSIVTVLPGWERLAEFLVSQTMGWFDIRMSGITQNGLAVRERLPGWPEVPNEIVTYIRATSSILTHVGGAGDPP